MDHKFSKNLSIGTTEKRALETGHKKQGLLQKLQANPACKKLLVPFFLICVTDTTLRVFLNLLFKHGKICFWL